MTATGKVLIATGAAWVPVALWAGLPWVAAVDALAVVAVAAAEWHWQRQGGGA